MKYICDHCKDRKCIGACTVKPKKDEGFIYIQEPPKVILSPVEVIK